jgi:hypothetical protein
MGSVEGPFPRINPHHCCHQKDNRTQKKKIFLFVISRGVSGFEDDGGLICPELHE